MAKSSGCTPAASTACTPRTPGTTVGIDRAGEFVDDLSERGVFLRRPAHDRERPDRPVPVIDFLDFHHWEIMLVAVIAQMVAERAFGQSFLGIDPAGDAKIGLGINGQVGFGL